MNRPRDWGDGRGWCYLGMAVGGSISVYANIAERFVQYNTRTKVWSPRPDPALDGIVLAAAAPIIVWLMLEILIRVRGNGTAAWVVRAMAVLVAAVAFGTSYQHLHDLLLARLDSQVTAATYPFGIDGLLVGAGLVLWQIRTHRGAPTAVADAAPDARGETSLPAPTPEPVQPPPSRTWRHLRRPRSRNPSRSPHPGPNGPPGPHAGPLPPAGSPAPGKTTRPRRRRRSHGSLG